MLRGGAIFGVSVFHPNIVLCVSVFGSGAVISAPRLYCYLETPRLLWVNLVTDALIALSYAVIFGCLIWIAARLRSLEQFRRYVWIFMSFGLFIVACGGTT